MRALPPFLAVLVFFIYIAPATCRAQSDDLIVIEGFVGKAETNNERFDDSQFFDGAVGYLSNGWLYRAGLSGVETYTLKDGGTAEVEIYGAYIQAVKIFDVGWMNLELGAGVYRNTIKAFLMDISNDTSERREVGKINEVNPFASLFVVKDLGASFSVQLGYKYQHDVGGVDISMLLAGARFRF